MMKSSFGKLKRFALHKSEEVKDHHNNTQAASALFHFDGLAVASEDMKNIRNCYDSLLSAAAATTNSAYEFSESLLEMGNCLLEKTSLNDDSDCGRALSTLGRVQLELRKLVDSYRSHIILTITKPSESLLNELRKVEEMKLQCDEKREVYEYMFTQHRDKGRSRGGKGDSVSSQQLQVAHEEYDDAARLCVFRVESLKQGQCRSLFTQAARHHSAQLNFFRRALESLEAVEPQINSFAVKQHIDYKFSGHGEVEIEDEEASSYESYEGGELSFDYRLNRHESDSVGLSRISVEADTPKFCASAMEDAATSIPRFQGEHVFNRHAKASSHSAPIYAENFESTERNKETQSSVKKFHTHVLPTPADAKSWTSKTSNSGLVPSGTAIAGGINNIWHSSPLVTEKQRKSTEDNILGRSVTNRQTPSIPLPRPSVEELVGPQSDSQYEFDHKKTERLAFSGPLSSRTPSSKPSVSSIMPTGSIEPVQINSGPLSRIRIVQPPSSINVPRSASPPPTSSPRISELHELPRPPGSVASKTMNIGNIGHSAPLISRKREVSPTNRSPPLAPNTGTALPPPPLSVSRSFSIPTSNQRTTALNMAKLVGSPRSRFGDVTSPPLTPISLANVNS
ncbi:hypothetical protein LIER_03789 [Lithospermum erythrorhizon]|uniref:BAR domain-containing protein n=1 Tax=Lithospermum erythrorhizon TaxID=34254 RepID=A0AAV3NVW5_LITER